MDINWLNANFEYYSPYIIAVLTSFLTALFTSLFAYKHDKVNTIMVSKNMVYLQYCKMLSINDFYNDGGLKMSESPISEIINISYVFAEYCIKYGLDVRMLLNHVYKLCYSVQVSGYGSYNDEWGNAIADILSDMKELLKMKPFSIKELEFHSL